MRRDDGLDFWRGVVWALLIEVVAVMLVLALWARCRGCL